MPEEDLYFDPLVFPCASGDQQYVGSAVETIEGVRLIKQRFPRSKTVLGISNVSFGLPTAGREVLNSVFLYHCTQAGLDMALVNSEKLERYPSLPEEERQLSEDLLYNRGAGPHHPLRRPLPRAQAAERRATSTLPLDERLAALHHRGEPRRAARRPRPGAEEARKPLDIINGPLMEGMDEVGRLFGDERADRRRGAAERRGDEGGGQPPRAAHGQGRQPRRGARWCSPR